MRARRDLRPCARRENHRLCDRLGRPPQLLGGLCDVPAPAGQVRAGRARASSAPRCRAPARWKPYEHRPPKTSFRLRQLFLVDRPGAAKPEWTYNMLLKHGVRSCLEYAKSFDLRSRARPFEPGTFPAPRIRRYWAATAMRRFGSAAMKCGPSSSASRGRSRGAIGPTAGQLRYRVVHTRRSCGDPASGRILRRQVLEGDPGLSI